MQKLNVLVGCENSGTVRDAFEAQGFDAWSCDVLAAPGKHFQCDVLEAVHLMPWHLFIVHPPCTYLTNAAARWVTPERRLEQDKAVRFALDCYHADIEHVALENPRGRLNTVWRSSDQEIQPFEYGHDASKRTGLWLKNLPKLVGTKRVYSRIVNGRARYANQTDRGENAVGAKKDRWKERSDTYPGVAEAMAKQWGQFIRSKHEHRQPSH